MHREYHATITLRADSQEAADRSALKAFWKWACEEGTQVHPLGFPAPWHEHEPTDGDPDIERSFRCVDCGKDRGDGEYYSVSSELWAAPGLAPNGGMLCLRCRLGRELCYGDFDALALVPTAWPRHVAERAEQQEGERQGELFSND